MADNGNSTEPPVPPRRTKRRIKIAPVEPRVTSTTATETTNDVAISQQKRPPPPPPPLPEKCRRNNSGYLENRQPQCDTAANCPRVEDKQHHRESRIIDAAEIEAKPHDNTTSAGDLSTSNGDPIPKSIASKPPFLTFLASSERKAFNKYPSLFFTLHDFENVVSDTWNRNPVDPEDPQDLREEESLKAHTLDDSDVCFRVTTTNLPFEKCLNRWRGPFDDGDFVRKFDDCQFDDKKNENDRTNDKRSSGYDVFDNNGNAKCRAGAKIRFAIESPNYSPFKSDSDVKIGVPCDSSRSSILNDEQAGEQRSAAFSMKLAEIREEFANARDCCDNARDKSYTSRVEKGNSAMKEDDPFIPAGANEVDEKLKTLPQPYCDNRNNNVYCEKIHENFDLIPWYAQTGNEIPETGKENIITGKTIASEQYDAKQVDETNTSSEVAENVRGLTDGSLKTACGIEEAAKRSQRRIYREGKMFLEKTGNEKCVAENEKLFFESPQNFLNVCNGDESNKNISTDDFINESVQIEQTRRISEGNKNRSDSFVDSKNNREIVSSSEDIFVKNIPVKVRRNSFLETMLSNELTDISNCAVISTTISTSIDNELSNPNKSSDKILELKTGITENKHLRDFYNATEIDTKNQKVLKHSKKEKISSVKSTQLVNKSTSDVKNDVLNELLCNFNNIKLKIVSPKNKKSVTKIEDENISRAIASDSRISKGKENASKFEKSQNDVRSVPLNTKIDMSNDTVIVEEDLTKMKIEEKPQDLKNDNLEISEKIANTKNIEIEKPNESFFGIKNKIIQDNSKIKKNFSDIKSKEINVKTSGERISEETEDTIEAEREPKKSRDIRIPGTILKKTSVECERQQTNEFRKRIPIGAPMTMNKIFDSKEFKAIADATRKDNLENGKCKEASREIHTRGKEKTDEVIVDDEADDDRRRIANRSALALVENTMSSGDNCAIARKTISVNPCNNIDNNRAVTPVVNVSNDQPFREVVTITPGKVRSFVKYYEIRGDAMIVKRHSKINDREKVARRKFTKSEAVPVATRNSQRPDVITKGMRGEDRNVKSNDLPSSNKIQSSTFASRVPEEPLNNPVCKTTETELKTKECEKSGLHVSDKETRASSKSGAKKSVQFLGNFTIINSETYGKDESADCDTNTSKRRRAPEVPPSQDCDYQKRVREIAKSEKPSNVGKDSLQSREDITQVSEKKSIYII